jgi:hypothetical protein
MFNTILYTRKIAANNIEVIRPGGVRFQATKMKTGMARKKLNRSVDRVKAAVQAISIPLLFNSPS